MDLPANTFWSPWIAYGPVQKILELGRDAAIVLGACEYNGVVAVELSEELLNPGRKSCLFSIHARE